MSSTEEVFDKYIKILKSYGCDVSLQSRHSYPRRILLNASLNQEPGSVTTILA